MKKIIVLALGLFYVVLNSGCSQTPNPGPDKDVVFKNLDTTANPGTDFFAYANGGWIKKNPIPAAYSAWGIFQGILKEVHSGAQTERPPFDEALKITLNKLGEVSYDMHTNGDREVFVRTYEQVVQKLEQDKYAIQKEDL